MGAISSNHYSHDQQLADAVDHLRDREPDLYAAFLAEFPEWAQIKGRAWSWIECDELGVDPEWPMWATDWIEEHSEIYWQDGEPWIDLPSDEMPCGHLRNDYNLDSAGIASVCNVCGHSIFDD